MSMSVCVRDDSRDLEAGACFWSSFLSWYVSKIVRQFSFLFSGDARILFKTTAMERFFYSIIASCLIEFLASRSLSPSSYQNKMTVYTLSLSSSMITDPAKSCLLWEVRRCSVDVVAVGDGGSRCAPSSRSRRWRRRRSSAPLFAAVVWEDPTRPPKRHLAHLRYNFLYWSSSPGRCVRVFFYATTPQLPMHSS